MMFTCGSIEAGVVYLGVKRIGSFTRSQVKLVFTWELREAVFTWESREADVNLEVKGS
jgi:hypothetical protein